MPAAPALSPSVRPVLPGARTGLAGRSTRSVRTRYRRQTAAVMLGTTVVGLWLGLAAPSVSPVAAPVPLSVVARAAGGLPDPGGPGPSPERRDGGGGAQARTSRGDRR